MKCAITLTVSVLLAVKMDILGNTVTLLARWGFSEDTVLLYVHPIARHVKTRMDIVVVGLVIQDTDVPQHVSNHMERIVDIHAVNTVTIKTVTDLTEVA